MGPSGQRSDVTGHFRRTSLSAVLGISLCQPFFTRDSPPPPPPPLSQGTLGNVWRHFSGVVARGGGCCYQYPEWAPQRRSAGSCLGGQI